MPDIPILGRGNGSGPAAIPLPAQRQYAAELTMVSGATHMITFDFGVPLDGQGLPQLGALKGFDPQAQAIANIVNTISAAQVDPLVARANKLQQAVTFTDTNGVHVVCRYVVSFRYLGPVDELPTEG